jgi:hypothetical protein
MVRGEGGKVGILGNVGSTSYGSHWAGQGPNPTLSANLHRINNLKGFFNRSATHSPSSFILFRISEI